MLGYLLSAGFVVAFSMVAHRLSGTILTAPMAFLACGAALSLTGVMPAAGAEAALHLLTEVTLTIVLFLDAARIDQRAILRRRAVWPLRMLALGLPLAFLMGIGLGMLVLPGWPLALIALVAAILLPTDAALGQPVLTNTDVPERPRHALTTESGLNGGLALPLVLMMAALAAPAADAPGGGWLPFALKQITLGPLVGATVGVAGGAALIRAQAAGWTSEVYEGIGALGLAAMAYLAAQMVGGNAFIAAFTAGLGFGTVVRGRCAFVFEFTEGEGQLLSWVAFLLVGFALVPAAVAHLTWGVALLILGSLLVLRPLAIWLALSGSDAAPETRIFLGWFGPRGLATALFALLVAGHLEAARAEQVLHLAANAVWISALLHGVTAMPGGRWYARALRRRGSPAESARVPHSSEVYRHRIPGRRRRR